MQYCRSPRPSAPSILFRPHQPITICRITYDSPPAHNQVINQSHHSSMYHSARQTQAKPVFTVQDLNYVPNTNSSMKRQSRNSNYCKGEKVVGKNILRPSNKPLGLNSLTIQTKQQFSFPHTSSPGHSQNQSLDKPKWELQIEQSFQTIRKVNQKLREMKLSESIEPIVQPYRDKSTDSYHYAHRHASDQISQNLQGDQFSNFFCGQPAKWSESFLPCGHNSYQQINMQMTSKLQTHPDSSSLRYYHIPNSQFDMPYSVIKQDLQGEKQSKQIAKHPEYKSKQLANKLQTPENTSTNEEGNYKKWKQPSTEPVNESEAQKCGKIRYLYQPYSMSLSSNHKNQNSYLYQSDQQTPKSRQSRPERVKVFRESSPQQMEIFEDEDKWDKILRIRQQSYQKTVSRQQSGDSSLNRSKGQEQTAAKTDGKYIHGGTLQELRPYKANSYQSSNAKQNAMRSYEESEKSGLYENDEQGTDQNKVSQSTNKLYQKLQEIVNHYKPNPVDELNKMKYSYSFEQNQEVQFREEKELFSRLLSCTQLEWMLIYSQMIAYVSQTYDKASQPQNKGLVDFVKIGESDDNRIMAHFIGIWLIWMGYEDKNVKQRVLENVELMFMDVDDIIAQDSTGSPESEPPSQHTDEIRSIAEIMYNQLFYGYLPESLQMQALIQTCRRGWQYFTFLICRLIKLLLKVSKRKIKKAQQGQQSTSHLPDNFLYQQLEKALELNL